MSNERQKKAFLGVPPGDVRMENPDGVEWSNRFDPVHNLWDETSRPKIQSGDWQVRPPDLKPRGRA